MLSVIHPYATHPPTGQTHLSAPVNPFAVARSVWRLVPADHSCVIAHLVKVNGLTKPRTTSEIQMPTLSVPDGPMALRFLCAPGYSP